MSRWFRYVDWPLRAKMAVLLVLASLVPLVVSTFIDIRDMRQELFAHTTALLKARGDELAGRLDAFNGGYRSLAERVSLIPGLQPLCLAAAVDRDQLKPPVMAILAVPLVSDRRVRGIAILDPAGRVHTATEEALVGVDMSYQRQIREALQDRSVICDIRVSEVEAGAVPTIAYLAPIHGSDGKLIGLVALWVRAAAIWDIMKESNSLAGPDSFSVLFDQQGIRIAHSYSTGIVFHPAGGLAPALVEELVAERRFGAPTRELLADVRAFPDQFDRAVSPSRDEVPFSGVAPVNNKLSHGIGHRLASVPWTVFYMIPGDSIDGPVAQMTWRKTLFTSLIILIALLVGMLSATVILRPVHALTRATGLLADGELAARVTTDRADELGVLERRFNEMAGRIEVQTRAVEQARDILERRVAERTAALESEVGVRKSAEAKLTNQIAHLHLLGRITRAIGERQDLESIFQVVVRSLEVDLPIDFGCACLYDPAAGELMVTSVGLTSAALAVDLGMPLRSIIPIDRNGLSHCVAGQLIYEPDTGEVPFPFPRRLAGGGLRALVAAPLRVEGRTFGVLIAARRQPNSFSSTECEFLRQLAEHVALAAHQSRLHSTLEKAYDDLRQTQQAVMQQERLRVLGQMASGIAHDINNAISPVMLYTESLLNREKGLSPKVRSHLEIILRASEDVAHTVGRMREFYRQGEAQAVPLPVDLNALVPQVVDLTRARWCDMAQQRGVTIQIRTSAHPGLPAIMGIASEIREALINLVINAVDAMPAGGTLTLRTGICRASPAEVSGSIFVEVEDGGVGMDEETSRRCLEPFFTTKGERGTGLGLAMVYGVVQRHLAEVGITTAVGRGTTIRLRFPVPIVMVEPAITAVVVHPPSHLRILLVDDDPILLATLVSILTDEDHVIVAANHGRTGIDRFRAAHGTGGAFDVVITDLGMPGVDGREVAREIKVLSPATPIILLTGWGQRLVAEGDVPPHVDCVLSKPPKLGELRAALARCCGSGEAIAVL